MGGFAPIAKRSSGEDDAEEPLTRPKLAWYSPPPPPQPHPHPHSHPAPVRRASPSGLQEVGGGALERALLESHRCFLLDCGAEVYVWVGRVAPLEERKEAAQAAERLLLQQKRPPSVRVTRLAERYETAVFKAFFDDWPLPTRTAREGEGKVKGEWERGGPHPHPPPLTLDSGWWVLDW